VTLTFPQRHCTSACTRNVRPHNSASRYITRWTFARQTPSTTATVPDCDKMARTFEDVDISPNPPQWFTLAPQVARLVRSRLQYNLTTRRKHYQFTTATPPLVLVELHQLDQRRPVQPPSLHTTRPRVFRLTSRTRHRVLTLWVTRLSSQWLPTLSPCAHLTRVSALPALQHNTPTSLWLKAAALHLQHLHQANTYKHHETFAWSGTIKGIRQMFKHSVLTTTLWYVLSTRLSRGISLTNT